MSFLGTLAGVILWILFVMGPSYPITGLNCLIAGITVIADAIGCTIYYSQAGTTLKIIIVLLFLANIIHFTLMSCRLHRRIHGV